jgi:integrase
MASLQKRKRKNGVAYVVQFMEDGRRRTLFLGAKYTKTIAREIKDVVEKIVDSRVTGIPLDARTEAWLSLLTDDMRRRFISAGLIKEKETITFGELMCSFFDSPHEWSEGTCKTSRHCIERLAQVIDCSRRADEITKQDILDAKQNLEKSYSGSTVGQTLGFGAQVYRWGVDLRLVAFNPFDGVKKQASKNKSREFFVERELFEKILDACEDDRFRNALVLYRYGGLRRSEAFLIRWDMIDYSKGTLKVLSPKTKKSGKSQRTVPLFPEIRDKLRKIPNSKDNLVVSDLICHNFQYQFKTLLQRNGFDVWPRLFQNLRSSRAIEINERFGPIAESEWLGHTQEVAKNHYLSVSKDLFASATC